MFIAHAPSGYLLAKAIIRPGCSSAFAKAIILVGVVGAVIPDIDMVYFYLFDHRLHHHKYFTHWPITWLALLLMTTVLLRWAATKKAAFLLAVFALGGMLHMLLDSVVGDIWWQAPWLKQPLKLFTIEAVYQPWWLNFILHWSFAVELLICLAAVYVCFKTPAQSDNA